MKVTPEKLEALKPRIDRMIEKISNGDIDPKQQAIAPLFLEALGVAEPGDDLFIAAAVLQGVSLRLSLLIEDFRVASKMTVAAILDSLGMTEITVDDEHACKLIENGYDLFSKREGQSTLFKIIKRGPEQYA